MNRIRMILALTVLMFFFAVGVRAQDDPATPTPEVSDVVEATEIVILNDAPAVDVTAIPTVDATAEPTALPLTDSEKATFSLTATTQVAIALIAAFLTGGLTVGGGILLALRTILRSPLLSNMIEKLFLSQPPTNQQTERKVIAGIKEIAAGADKLTDGVLEPEGTVS